MDGIESCNWLILIWKRYRYQEHATIVITDAMTNNNNTIYVGKHRAVFMLLITTFINNYEMNFYLIQHQAVFGFDKMAAVFRILFKIIFNIRSLLYLRIHIYMIFNIQSPRYFRIHMLMIIQHSESAVCSYQHLDLNIP